jgi:hypothetical protein
MTRARFLLFRSYPAPRDLAPSNRTEPVMIEFAAGILVGGSVGAVIMGALLSQVRLGAPDILRTAVVQSRATMQAPQQSASRFARHPRFAESLPVGLRSAALAVVSPQLH